MACVLNWSHLTQAWWRQSAGSCDALFLVPTSDASQPIAFDRMVDFQVPMLLGVEVQSRHSACVTEHMSDARYLFPFPDARSAMKLPHYAVQAIAQLAREDDALWWCDDDPAVSLGAQLLASQTTSLS